jgi:hypothetical protein
MKIIVLRQNNTEEIGMYPNRQEIKLKNSVNRNNTAITKFRLSFQRKIK